LVEEVSAWEILSHRIVWSVLLLLAILAIKGELKSLRIPRRQIPKVFLTAALLSTNWLIFIYAVVNDNIAETALGYFINPLISIFLAVVFLKERLRPLQWMAIGLAATGIGVQLLWFGEVPFISLALALSFGLYGLFRKNLNLPAIAGLAIETLMILPFALVYLAYAFQQNHLMFGQVIRLDVLLILSGFVTSVPLLCFAAGVNRLSLTAMGMFQYLAPTLSLLLAVFVYREPFTSSLAVAFGFIWLALLIYTAEAWFFHRKRLRRAPL
jgi:chloramphenicol-sensitive protein RarD